MQTDPTHRSREQGASAAAVVLIVLVAILAVLVGVLLAVRQPRKTSAEQLDPHAWVQLRAPRGEILDPPKEFSWFAFTGASSYRVTISDEDALWPLFVKTTSKTFIALEPKELAGISPGRIHVWEVEALGANGQLVARGALRFRLIGTIAGPPSPGQTAKSPPKPR